MLPRGEDRRLCTWNPMNETTSSLCIISSVRSPRHDAAAKVKTNPWNETLASTESTVLSSIGQRRLTSPSTVLGVTRWRRQYEDVVTVLQ